MSDRECIRGILEAWVEKPPRHPVVRILEGKKPEHTQQPLYFKEAPRFIVGVEGTGRYMTVENGRETVFNLERGQVLYFAPCTWSCPIPQTAYKSLAVTLRDNSIRITLHSRSHIAKNGAMRHHCLAQWQASVSLGARGEHLMKLFDDRTPSHCGDWMYAALAKILLTEVLGVVESAPEETHASDTLLWNSLCDYISIHWSDPMLSREKVAEFFKRHPNHISRFFNRHTKENFRSYVNELRLKRSVELLKDLRHNVTDVSALCGFTDLQYFIRCFRKRFGMTPGDYRKQKL